MNTQEQSKNVKINTELINKKNEYSNVKNNLEVLNFALNREKKKMNDLNKKDYTIKLYIAALIIEIILGLTIFNNFLGIIACITGITGVLTATQYQKLKKEKKIINKKRNLLKYEIDKKKVYLEKLKSVYSKEYKLQQNTLSTNINKPLTRQEVLWNLHILSQYLKNEKKLKKLYFTGKMDERLGGTLSNEELCFLKNLISCDNITIQNKKTKKLKENKI